MREGVPATQAQAWYKRITDILVDALRDRYLHATEVTRAMGEVQLCPKHRRHRPP